MRARAALSWHAKVGEITMCVIYIVAESDALTTLPADLMQGSRRKRKQ
tara:strand:+ start:926 stop:1069 length:144 start_codon:yes stop_codon:yes gene_type:complete